MSRVIIVGTLVVTALVVGAVYANRTDNGSGTAAPSPYSPGGDGTDSLSGHVDQAYGSEDPRSDLAVSLETSGFEGDASACIADAVVDDFDRDAAVAGAAALEGEFLFNDNGDPVDDGAWRILQTVTGCTTDEAAARLADRGLPSDAAQCIATSARSNESIAVALALYSASLTGPHGRAAAELAARLLDTESAAVVSDDSTAALLVARAPRCVSPEAALTFLASTVGE